MELPAHIKLVFVDTPEKFQPLAADIVPPLIGLLGDLCALEEKFYARDQAQKASRPGGIYATQAHPNSTALWERYRPAVRKSSWPGAGAAARAWGTRRTSPA